MSILLLCIAFLFGISIGVSVTLIINVSNNNSAIIANTPCECEQQPNNQTTPTFTLSLFNEMNSHLSMLANKPVEVSRKQYHVGALPRGGGGLDDSDRDLLARIYFNASSVFEFGLGESTHIAAYVGVTRYSGVDNEAEWVEKARDGAKMDHFRFSLADTGKTSMHGNPINDKMQKIPFNYQSAPLNNEEHAFDFYLVDGRYRVATACSSFLHSISRGGDMSRVMVGVHDWGPARTNFFVLKRIAVIVHQSNNLAVLKMKPNISERDIHDLWKSHIWDRR